MLDRVLSPTLLTVPATAGTRGHAYRTLHQATIADLTHASAPHRPAYPHPDPRTADQIRSHAILLRPVAPDTNQRGASTHEAYPPQGIPEPAERSGRGSQ